MSCNSVLSHYSRNSSFKSLPVTLLYIFLLSACSGSDYDPPESNEEAAGSWQEHACEMAAPEGLTEEDFTCGTFTVPNDWDFPQGETIGFEVAVLKARNSPSKPDPLVFFGGGPGAWNLEGYLSREAGGVLTPISETRDIVFFDKRGNGLSTPSLFCQETYDQERYAYSVIADTREHTDALLIGYQNCHARLTGEGIDLSNFNSYQTSADVVALMDALSYGDYNLYGISYGGREAQVMVRDHPEKVRSLILDSPAMPEVSFGTFWAPNFDRSLNVLLEACTASSTCAALYPNLRATLVEVVSQLNAVPHYSPLTQADGTRVDVYITGDRFILGIQSAMYQAALIPLLPLVISSTAAGDMGLLDSFVPQLLGNVSSDAGLYASTLCAEEIPFDTLESAAKAVEGLDPILTGPTYQYTTLRFFDMCDIWQVSPRPAIEIEPVISDIPALVLSGQYDPATPPSNGEKAASNLSSSQYFLFNGISHGVLRSDKGKDGELSCAARIVTDFLADPASAVDGACAAGLPGPFE